MTAKNLFAPIVAALLFLPASALAQVLVDHQQISGTGGLGINGVLSMTDIEYDVDGGGDAEVERTILGVSIANGLTDSLNLYGSLGFILESEIDGSSDDGDGYMLAVGLKGPLMFSDQFSLRSFGEFRFISEDYGGSSDADIYEVQFDVIGRLSLQEELGIYAGVDIIPISEGEIDLGRAEADFERDSPVGLRVGADYRFGAITVNAELGLVSEEGLIIRVSTPIG